MSTNQPPDNGCSPSHIDPKALTEQVKALAKDLGFHEVGISSIDISAQRPRLEQWLQQGYQGEM